MDDSLDESSDARRLAPEALVGVVETVLAQALRLAAEAERWEIVAPLAEELAARRRSRGRRSRTGVSTPEAVGLECTAHEPAGHPGAQHAVRRACRRATRSG